VDSPVVIVSGVEELLQSLTPEKKRVPHRAFRRSEMTSPFLSQFSEPTVTTGRRISNGMIRKLKSGEFRLYSRKKDAKSGKRKNLGTFSSLAAAKKHERAVQYFKRAG
jgi:hypothetical protein